jgi:pilus assembly protein Flp/PilA
VVSRKWWGQGGHEGYPGDSRNIKFAKKRKEKDMFTYLKFWLESHVKDERGVTVIEYALMLFMVAVAVVAAVGPLRNAVLNVFNNATSAVGGS